MGELEQTEPQKNKIKVFFKKAGSFIVSVIAFSALIGVSAFGLALMNVETEEQEKVKREEEKNKIDFKKRFVTFKEGKESTKSIILDVENHCLYVGEGGVIQSPIVKDRQFDCNIKYTEEYKNKNKKGDKK